MPVHNIYPMEFSELPPVVQSTIVLLVFIALFIVTSWLLEVINKISSESK
jgi:hypothetical protein